MMLPPFLFPSIGSRGPQTYPSEVRRYGGRRRLGVEATGYRRGASPPPCAGYPGGGYPAGGYPGGGYPPGGPPRPTVGPRYWASPKPRIGMKMKERKNRPRPKPTPLTN